MQERISCWEGDPGFCWFSKTRLHAHDGLPSDTQERNSGVHSGDMQHIILSLEISVENRQVQSGLGEIKQRN